ncbi:hypothetical protein [Thiorhodococcus fuscus]|uniref:Uncharacterized protein n=1 Tax=Thiorhodococcus fuscus TaxID=527200 RepID=A0ABW4YCP1_9GAMM
MSDIVLGHCWNCGRALTAADYGREASCRACDKPTRCCRNCAHYAPGRANACREPMVERVLDKTRANFCELFEPTSPDAAGNGRADPDQLRSAADDLFK